MFQNQASPASMFTIRLRSCPADELCIGIMYCCEPLRPHLAGPLGSSTATMSGSSIAREWFGPVLVPLWADGLIGLIGKGFVGS